MAYPDPYNFDYAEGQSTKSGGDMNSAMDIGQLLSRLAEGQFSQYGGLQSQVVDLMSKLIGGDTSGIDKMFAPQDAAMKSQLGHAQRNVQDTVPTSQLGDAMSKLGSNAITAKAGAYNQFLQPFFQQATSLGSNAMSSQVMPWLAAAGQIMKKPASGGGGLS